MNPLGTTFSVTALANAIACRLNDDELSLFAVMVTQLGDTLETIAVQRTLCENKENKK